MTGGRVSDIRRQTAKGKIGVVFIPRFATLKRINSLTIPPFTSPLYTKRAGLCGIPLSFDKKARLKGCPVCREKRIAKPLFPRLLCVKGAVMRSMTEGLSCPYIRVSLYRAKT